MDCDKIWYQSTLYTVFYLVNAALEPQSTLNTQTAHKQLYHGKKMHSEVAWSRSKPDLVVELPLRSLAKKQKDAI